MRDTSEVIDLADSPPTAVGETIDRATALVRLADEHPDASYRLARAILRDPVSIGSLTGFSMDVSVDPAWKKACGAGRMRLYILSLGPDRALVVDVEAQDKATWDALTVEATAIVDSFAFQR